VGKNKLGKWTELNSFSNVVQPKIGDISGKDHQLKGRWNNRMFGNNNPIIIELGCGKGEYTVGLATMFPQNNYIGIDIKGARMWRGAKTSNEQKLSNVAFLRTRIEFINSFFSTDEVDEIWITFPDPHPGGRNSNKRLTSPWFLNSYRQFVKNKGLIHLKTDNIDLFNFTKSVVIYNNLNLLFTTNDLYSESQSNEILSIRTHYEKTFMNEGFKINYLSFRLEKEKLIIDAAEKAKGK